MASLTERVVGGEGRIPSRLMLVGEAPGQEEAARGRPFVGKTGKEQDAHLERNGLSRRDFYITNLRKTFIPGNPAPTPEEVAKWGPVLEQEIENVRPKFILAVGGHSVRYFLGEGAHLDAVHGIPHQILRGGRAITILPGYHPAARFYAPDLLQFILYDYARAAAAIRGEIPLNPPTDQYPSPKYTDADDRDLEVLADCGELAVDTEGVPGDEWSFQLTGTPGTGVVVRRSNPRFAQSLRAFRRIAKGKILIGHNLLYELEMFRAMGLDLLDASLRIKPWDTMMASYLTAMEPQSLKNLARRHCGMVMKDYMDTVGDAGREKQMGYLERVWQDTSFEKPGPRVERENDGTCRVYTPQPVQRRAEAILIDVMTGKLVDGEPVDPYKRWKKVDRELRLMVEKKHGPMPVGTLADIPLKDAVYYAGRDPDATLRVYRHLKPMLESSNLSGLMKMKMGMYPAAAEMKLNGFLAKRSHFEWLVEEMWDQQDRIVNKISKVYFGGKPFNPNSPDQVRNLMRRRGLQGEKLTKKTKQVSTSKKSIEHLRFEDDSIELVEQWRERAKIKDSFGTSLLELFPEGVEEMRISGDFKMTRVTSGRFSMADPNLMAIPARTELGTLIREGFVAEAGYVLGTWDLDQIEMRVMADESQDDRLLKLFNDDKVDIHTDNASKIFGIPYDRVDKMEHRYPAKRAGFGIITGIQGPGLFDQLRMAGCMGWSVEKCDKLIRDWLNLFPGVKYYMEACGVECERNGGVIKDRWGMPRYLPGILSDDRYERFEARRQSHSHKIQGGAQGLLQNAMAHIYPRLKVYGDAVRWILQIHDELIMEVLDGLQEEVNQIMIEGLTKHGAQLRVPVKSKGSYGPNWKLLEK